MSDTWNVAVVGLGKIGLPLAVHFAEMGCRVRGADINEATVGAINSRVTPFPGEAFLEEKLERSVEAGRLTATSDTAEAVSLSNVVVVVVPLFVDAEGAPEFTAMDEATRDIARGLTPGTLVAYETTVPVGTTRKRFAHLLAEGSGLEPGVDFHVVFSPERVLTGRVFADLRRYPKLVGGISPSCESRGVEFYEAVLDFDERPELGRANGVWALGSAEAAEMAKLAETTYRDVNIGLANEFARFAATEGIDIQSVIEACNSQPYSHIHQPGIAVGGHCIPIYPRLYLWNDPEAQLVRTARETNAGMPGYALEQVELVHGGLAGQKVAVLGASYRGGVKETAFSGVFPVVEGLHARGAHVGVHDPMYSEGELASLGFEAHHLGEPADVVVVQANHPEYADLGPQSFPGVRTVLDGRRILDRAKWDGVNFLAVGLTPLPTQAPTQVSLEVGTA